MNTRELKKHLAELTEKELMNTKQIIDKIFKDPKTKYELTKFENLGKLLYEAIEIYPKTITRPAEKPARRNSYISTRY